MNKEKLKKVENLVRNMSEYQIEKYCSRGSVWWEAQNEYHLRSLQENKAAEILYKELYENE